MAVGGITLQQQRREQLDQSLIAEDMALLEQESVLEPAIPQLSSIRGEASTVREGAKESVEDRKKSSFDSATMTNITKFFNN